MPIVPRTRPSRRRPRPPAYRVPPGAVACSCDGCQRRRHPVAVRCPPASTRPCRDPAGAWGLAGRRGRKRRLAIVGGAVVGAMTLGAGAVAASSEDFRESVNHTVGVIFQPSGETPDVAPKPAKPAPTDIPAAPAPSTRTFSGGRSPRRLATGRPSSVSGTSVRARTPAPASAPVPATSSRRS